MALVYDVGITSVCLASSAYLYLLHHRRHSIATRSPAAAAGYVLTNQVVHARLLPAESKHAFSYHTLSLLLSLSDLENKSLNRGWGGTVFGYPGIWGRVCGLRPQTYLRDQSRAPATIREKLVELLEPCGIQLGQVWMMTMPSFLGFEGINPLTVYFCYEEGKTNVWGLVLEVHNTFGERHAYVLQVGKDEDKEKSKEYDHQWTFARQFHVSPFNDRSGHYVCSVVMPSYPPSVPMSADPPRPVIRLHLVTAPPSRQVKLVALLRPTVSEPLTARTLLAALVLPPFRLGSSEPYLGSNVPKPSPASWSSLPLGAALLLTSLRIVYQAGRLHYQRGLGVFARPEPTAGAGRGWVEQALGGVWNDVQNGAKRTGGSIGWQTESRTERWARKRFEARTEAAAKAHGIRVRIASTDPRVPVAMFPADAFDGGGGREFTLYYRSARTWTCLLLAPTAQGALELGSRIERWFAVSDERLFCQLWQTSGSGSATGWVVKAVGWVRARLDYIPDRAAMACGHPLDDPASLLLLFHVGLVYVTFHAERIVFALVRARFVKGDAPWRVWERIDRRARVGAGGIGSLLE